MKQSHVTAIFIVAWIVAVLAIIGNLAVIHQRYASDNNAQNVIFRTTGAGPLSVQFRSPARDATVTASRGVTASENVTVAGDGILRGTSSAATVALIEPGTTAVMVVQGVPVSTNVWAGQFAQRRCDAEFCNAPFGECIMYTGGGGTQVQPVVRCLCDMDLSFIGDRCGFCALSDPVTCRGQGQLVFYNGTTANATVIGDRAACESEPRPTCSCDGNWEGASCDECSPFRASPGCGACTACSPFVNSTCGRGLHAIGCTVGSGCSSASCICEAGRTGPVCDQFTSSAACLSGCIGDECDRCGTCRASGGAYFNTTGSCAPCPDYWRGSACQNCTAPASIDATTGECTVCSLCDDNACGGASHGLCTLPPEGCFPGGRVTCTCRDGWTGSACDTCSSPYALTTDSNGDDVCTTCVSCPSSVCNNRGTCAMDPSTGCTTPLCTCTDPGFTGDRCDLCLPGFYGKLCTPCACGTNERCDDGLGGSGACTCLPGWTGPTCQEVVCTENPDDAPYILFAASTSGGAPACRCLPGYNGQSTCQSSCSLAGPASRFRAPACYYPGVVFTWVEAGIGQVRSAVVLTDPPRTHDLFGARVLTDAMWARLASPWSFDLSSISMRVGFGSAAVFYLLEGPSTILFQLPLGNAALGTAQLGLEFPSSLPLDPVPFPPGMHVSQCRATAVTRCVVVVYPVEDTDLYAPSERQIIPANLIEVQL